jgi:hypothetical protein
MRTPPEGRHTVFAFVSSLVFAALSCGGGTLTVDGEEPSRQVNSASGGGTGVLTEPPAFAGGAGGGSAGGGSAGGGSAGGGSAGGGSAGGGSAGGGSTGGGSTGGGSTGGGSTGGGSTGGGSTGGGSTGGGSTGGGSTGGGSTGGGSTGGGSIDQAIVIGHTIPAQLACGQRRNVTVTVRNTGDTTWTAAGNYRLGAVDDQDPLFTSGNRIELGPANSVAPGQEHTFTFELVAPLAGSYVTDWRMVHDGVQWFGAIAASTITVACAANGAFYPCVIDGQFNMPAHEQRIASRNASLLRLGHVITGNDQIDNATLGGGSPDGGIWLSGQFHFEVDANGQITSASWITVFSAVHYPVTGGVYPNGEIHMGSPAGLDISGLISGGIISGFVAEAGMSITRGDSVWNALSTTDRSNIRGIWHGNDLEYVHGLMSGTWVAR